jgi:uncharacterized protein (DUF983 family)
LNNSIKPVKHNYLWALLNNKCPHCRQGDIFQDKSSYRLKTFMKMNERCPICEQKTEIEPGFYYGTGYVSYAVTVVFCASTFVAWWVLIGFSVDDSRVFWWLGLNAFLLVLFQPYFMRLSRTIWLSFFVRYDAGWQMKESS